MQCHFPRQFIKDEFMAEQERAYCEHHHTPVQRRCRRTANVDFYLFRRAEYCSAMMEHRHNCERTVNRNKTTEKWVCAHCRRNAAHFKRNERINCQMRWQNKNICTKNNNNNHAECWAICKRKVFRIKFSVRVCLRAAAGYCLHHSRYIERQFNSLVLWLRVCVCLCVSMREVCVSAFRLKACMHIAYCILVLLTGST